MILLRNIILAIICMQHYKLHKQQATKVCFNEFNENLLISGSKDGTINLYDIRQSDLIYTFRLTLHFILKFNL